MARALAGLAFVLILAGIGSQWMRIARGHENVGAAVHFFNLDGERNLPTFFAVLLLLFASLLLAVIARLEVKQPQLASKWTILSTGFLSMAFDEAFSVHERLNEPFGEMLGDSQRGIFYFAWVIPGIALVLALAAFFYRFLQRLPAKTRNRILMAAAVYIGGALGIELFGGRYAELHGTRSVVYIASTLVEESLEMAGVILFIRALLAYIAENHRRVQFDFGGDHKEES